MRRSRPCDTIRILLLYHCFIDLCVPVNCLSGHVCGRERAENYLTSYNQAFLCQERYTTSCGHLDWRRCTRYRVQTCFTPKQRYATRYHHVEVCCPGWREDGSGSCSIPICTIPCQNGGSCVDTSGTPGCICEEGYHGDRCQHEKNKWEAWQTVTVCAFALLLILAVAITFIMCKRFSKRRNALSSRVDEISLRRLKAIGRVNDSYNNTEETNAGRIRELAMPDRDNMMRVYPSAPADISGT